MRISVIAPGASSQEVAEALHKAADGIATGALCGVLEDAGDVAIDAEDLENECIRWSGHYAWQSRLAADADAAERRAENATKLLRAKALVRILSSEGKRPTTKLADAMADCDDAVVVARDVEVEALRKKRRLSGELEALRGKKDMLVQLASKRRKEMENEITIKERK